MIHLQPEVTSISDSANTKTRRVAMVAPVADDPTVAPRRDMVNHAFGAFGLTP